MAFQSVPNTAAIDVIYTYADQTLQNTYYARWEQPGLYDEADLAALASTIDAGPVQTLLASQGDKLNYERTLVRGLHSEIDFQWFDATNAGEGAVNAERMPASVAFCVSQRTGLIGRSARGRVYIAGLTGTHMEVAAGLENWINNPYAEAFKAAVNGFRTTINGLPDWSAVLVSRYSGGSKRAVALTFDWASTLYTTRRVSTMRSRLL